MEVKRAEPIWIKDEINEKIKIGGLKNESKVQKTYRININTPECLTVSKLSSKM